MTPYQAYSAAASWGSYMTATDPGACMYGFSEDCRPQSEEHRARCLAWIDGPCREAAGHNIAAGEYLDGHEELDALRAYLAAAPVKP